MDDIPISALIGALIFLIILSAFFSGSETGLVSLNRYRLRHLAKTKHRGAARAAKLLERPDRLIGLILLGNNFVNILASSIATILALRLYGEAGIAIAAAILTLVILIFSEVTPKTLAVLHPERFAFPATFVLSPLLKILYPLVWMVNIAANGLLRLGGINTDTATSQALSSEELRMVVTEAGAMIPRRHQMMLTNILDLEKVTVDDIMIPRNELVGIDMHDEWDDILKQLTNSQHTRMPVFDTDINNVLGMIHVRNTLQLLTQKETSKEDLKRWIHPAYFVPEGTPLNKQLLHFQQEKRRSGLVVDEYGDVQGLVTLEDILEEIVGEFTTDPATHIKEVHRQKDGTFLVDGSASIRELNRVMQWELPTNGPKTFSGLITEHMESIPEPGTSLMLAGYPVEIVQTKDNMVKTAQINPNFRRPKSDNSTDQPAA
ncbi:MAG: HlyC/CorC family transporter [Gammaproteobacteria bacterium]|nr:HlyC/CorC family transporter [Gammaproteobacteria bacterium]MCF6261016.1 HlyC/CorC family transporter [Gammaproteobacteria bacterium]